MSVGVGSGSLLPLPTSEVDADTAEELLSTVRDLAAATTARGIGRAERVSRASRLAERAAGVEQLARWLDPYVDGRRSRTADLVAAAGGADRDAADRLAQARQADLLGRAWADLNGLLGGHGVDPAATGYPSPAAWLNTFAVPATTPLGPAQMVPTSWSDIPEAVINPTPGTELGGGPAVLEGELVPWTVAGWAVDASRQLRDWSPDSGAELDRLISVVVDTGLERELLANLLDGAPAAADFQAAEVAVGSAWPSGADLLLCSPADRPLIVRQYAAQNLGPQDRPQILATAGCATGTAVMLATGAVWLVASAAEWLTADRPRELGQDVAVIRYGRATCRRPGAVVTVPVSTAGGGGQG